MYIYIYISIGAYIFLYIYIYIYIYIHEKITLFLFLSGCEPQFVTYWLAASPFDRGLPPRGDKDVTACDANRDIADVMQRCFLLL